MKHLGDVTKINGAEIPVVDVIIGGSPCQDLSIAGKRAGLEGERSGLFMEQIRVVKEMREHDRNNKRADEFIRPRYMVWENVEGALSSAGKGLPKGSDFQAVLTEIVKIAKPDAPDVPMPESGRWPKSGMLYGCGVGGWFSVAYRVHDAQYWGVPQRRKRIALLADFNGLTAGEIMFGHEYWRDAHRGDEYKAVGHSGDECGQKISSISKSLSGNSESCGEEGEGTAGDFEDCFDKQDKDDGVIYI